MGQTISDIHHFEGELNRWRLYLGYIKPPGEERKLCVTNRRPNGTKVKVVCIGPHDMDSLRITGIHSHHRVNGIGYFELQEFSDVIRGTESKLISRRSFEDVLNRLFQIFCI